MTATIHEEQVDFLDTTVFKGNNFKTTHKLETKVFFKPTDTHVLLFKSSHHPKHTFLGIIKSQLLWFHRICSRQEDSREATKVLFWALSKRWYSRSTLQRAYKTYLVSRPKITTAMLFPVIMDYSTSTLKFMRIIKRQFTAAQQQLQDLQEHKIIAAFRKGKTLRDLLVQATVPPTITQPKVKKTLIKAEMGKEQHN